MDPIQQIKSFARQHADKCNKMYYDALRSGKRYISCVQQLQPSEFRFTATIEYNYTDHPNPIFPKIDLRPLRQMFIEKGIDYNNIDFFEFCDHLMKVRLHNAS